MYVATGAVRSIESELAPRCLCTIEPCLLINRFPARRPLFVTAPGLASYDPIRLSITRHRRQIFSGVLAARRAGLDRKGIGTGWVLPRPSRQSSSGCGGQGAETWCGYKLVGLCFSRHEKDRRYE